MEHTINKQYFVTYREENKVVKKEFPHLSMARKFGITQNHLGAFIKLENKKGTKLPL